MIKTASRACLFIAALALAYMAFVYSSNVTLRRADPELAYRYRPNDALTLTAALNRRFQTPSALSFSDTDIERIRSALGEAPLNRTLLRVLGAYYDLKGERGAAFRAMDLANRVSRRDLIVELWLAEYYGRNNEAKREVAHFNAALAVHPELRNSTFDRMFIRLSDAGFREGMREYIGSGADWTRHFLVSSLDRDWRTVGELIAPVLGRSALGRDPELLSDLAWNYQRVGDTRQAVRLLSYLDKNFTVDRLSSLAVSSDPLKLDLGRFSWKSGEDDDIVYGFEDDGSLSVSVRPNGAGLVLQKDVMVNGGRSYDFASLIEQEMDTDPVAITWTFSCLSLDSKNVASPIGTASKADSGRLSAKIALPGDCHILRVVLSASGADSQFGSNATISRISIKPSR